MKHHRTKLTALFHVQNTTFQSPKRLGLTGGLAVAARPSGGLFEELHPGPSFGSGAGQDKNHHIKFFKKRHADNPVLNQSI